MRRFASVAGISLIVGGSFALVAFAASARALPVTLPLIGNGGVHTAADGSGSGTESTTTTVGGSGSASSTTTTIGGTGSGSSTTTTVAGGGGTTTTSTTLAGGGSGTTTSSSTTTTRPGSVPPGGTAPGAPGSPCPGAQPSIALTLQAVPPGGSTNVSGNCFNRNIDIGLTLFSDPVVLGIAHTDATGAFNFTVTIPGNTAPGTHTLAATGGGQSATIPLIVSSQTPFGVTGISWNMLVLGLALVAGGVIVLAGDRIGKQELVTFQ